MATTGTLSDLCYHFIEPSQLSAWLMGIQPPSGMTSGTVVIHFPKRLLELYTHCTRQEIIVKQAIDGELERSLVARRSAMAIQQLGQVNVILAQQSLNHGRDQRKSALLKRNGELDTSLIYNASGLSNRQIPAQMHGPSLSGTRHHLESNSSLGCWLKDEYNANQTCRGREWCKPQHVNCAMLLMKPQHI